MNWLSRMLPGGSAPDLPPALRDRLEAWQQRAATHLDARHGDLRYVVLNTESPGLDVGNETPVTVAALGVERAALGNRDGFLCTLETDAAEALVSLLEFIGKSPVVVFNSAINRRALTNAFEKHLGFEPELNWLDLYWLLPALMHEHHSSPMRLSNWARALEIESATAGRALHDAHTIAQLLLIALSRANMAGRRTPASLIELESTKRRVLRIT